jgi:hypothetical protein
MEAACSSQTLVYNQKTVWHNNPESLFLTHTTLNNWNTINNIYYRYCPLDFLKNALSGILERKVIFFATPSCHL